MWGGIAEGPFELMRVISDAIGRACAKNVPHDLFRSASTLFLTSDYGGTHKASGYESYSFSSRI